MLFLNTAVQMIENVARMRWPASMLANNRTISENGRTRKYETSSMITTSGRIAFGTPGGTIAFFTYLNGPCFAIPTTLKIT